MQERKHAPRQPTNQSGGNAVCTLIAKKPRRSPARFTNGAMRRSAALGERRNCNHYVMHLHNPPICNTIR